MVYQLWRFPKFQWPPILVGLSVKETIHFGFPLLKNPGFPKTVPVPTPAWRTASRPPWSVRAKRSIHKGMGPTPSSSTNLLGRHRQGHWTRVIWCEDSQRKLHEKSSYMEERFYAHHLIFIWYFYGPHRKNKEKPPRNPLGFRWFSHDNLRDFTKF